jgi:CHASE2 domain-containing sensor protein/YHS domain-containing protein
MKLGDDTLFATFRNWLRSKFETWGLGLFIVVLVIPFLVFTPQYTAISDRDLIFELDSRMQYRYIQEKEDVHTALLPHDPQIVVLLVDDAALRVDDRLSKPVPLSRTYLADLLRYVADAKPSAIGVDFFLDRPSERPVDDDDLADAIRHCVATNGVPLVLGTSMAAREEGQYIDTPPIQTLLVSPRVWTGHTLGGRGVSDARVRWFELFRPSVATAGPPAGQQDGHRLSFAGAVALASVHNAALTKAVLRPDGAIDGVDPSKLKLPEPGVRHAARWSVKDLLTCFGWDSTGASKSIDFSLPAGHRDGYAVASTAFVSNLSRTPLRCPVTKDVIASRDKAAATVFCSCDRKRYYFCSTKCQDLFTSQPHRYISTSGSPTATRATPEAMTAMPALTGKVVLIGAGYSDTTDQHNTPLGSLRLGLGQGVRSHVYGAEIQAYIVATLRRALKRTTLASKQRTYLPEVQSWIKEAVACLLAAVLGLVFHHLAVRRGGFGTMLACSVATIAIYYAFFAQDLFYSTEGRVWLPFVRPAAMLGLTAVWSSWALRKRDRDREELQRNNRVDRQHDSLVRASGKHRRH